MFHPYTVALFGHRQLDNALQVEQRLEGLLRKLLCTHAQVDFLIGRNGEFDLLAASVIRRVRRDFDARGAALILILPYLTAEFRDNEAEFLRYYDSIEVFPTPPGRPQRACIPLRNRAMIDRADAVICCLDRASGGSYEAAAYALTRHKPLLHAGTLCC